ncbi:MAG: four helix bundle protein [Acidobacteriaceae bacterium]
MTVSIYRASRSFPDDERFGLTSQLRRAAVSVASNIAEGCGRLTEGEFRQFLGLAQGSNCEVQTQILVAKRLGIGDSSDLDKAQELSVEVAKMLSSLIGSLRARS